MGKRWRKSMRMPTASAVWAMLVTEATRICCSRAASRAEGVDEVGGAGDQLWGGGFEGGHDGRGIGVGVVLGVEGVSIEAGRVCGGLVEGSGGRRRVRWAVRAIPVVVVGGVFGLIV